mmetsp:Transcript_87847/g.253671  ORF Transcript_87847/g.253671 Transcript_87847/m.253671 type:complete len:272 (+) Transcript_87847:1298-2113(+)
MSLLLHLQSDLALRLLPVPALLLFLGFLLRLLLLVLAKPCQRLLLLLSVRALCLRLLFWLCRLLSAFVHHLHRGLHHRLVGRHWRRHSGYSGCRLLRFLLQPLRLGLLLFSFLPLLLLLLLLLGDPLPLPLSSDLAHLAQQLEVDLRSGRLTYKKRLLQVQVRIPAMQHKVPNANGDHVCSGSANRSRGGHDAASVRVPLARLPGDVGPQRLRVDEQHPRYPHAFGRSEEKGAVALLRLGVAVRIVHELHVRHPGGGEHRRGYALPLREVG